jgi:uncharacterized membrane protein YhiD involved in acid resistance
VKDGLNVKNLTTASSIWFAGAIGMALGFGFYVIATVSALACTIIPRIPHFNKKSPESMQDKPVKPLKH